ncbi:MAG: ral stress protein CsbD [Rhodoferax sp.]|nr:ral stress protein CsbD [Rhodoferax sp.]
MNNDRMQGNWTEFKGKLKEQWGKLTDDDLDVVQGQREQLLGRLQERHGYTKEVAHHEVLAWEKKNPSFFFEKS